MKHLTSDELVDIADGSRTEASVPHLAACAACRAALADIRSVMSKVASVDVPEPSPLFWDHLSARVSEAVAAEPAPRNAPWFDAIADWRHLWRGGFRSAIAIAAAAAVIAVLVIGRNVTHSTVAVPVPAVADSAAPAEAVEGMTLLPPDDPALDAVADLGIGLDWDEIHDAGIVAHTGVVDRAVSGLSARERAELGRLLKQELAASGGGN